MATIFPYRHPKAIYLKALKIRLPVTREKPAFEEKNVFVFSPIKRPNPLRLVGRRLL